MRRHPSLQFSVKLQVRVKLTYSFADRSSQQVLAVSKKLTFRNRKVWTNSHDLFTLLYEFEVWSYYARTMHLRTFFSTNAVRLR